MSLTAAPARPRPATDTHAGPLHLDTLSPSDCSVGYGELGTGGSLGYDQQRVIVGGRRYAHALSTHPPARVTWTLDGSWRSFRCQVTLNDDVTAGRSYADFVVYADGRRVAEAYRVMAGDAPRTLEADVAGARTLELTATTRRWNFSHAVWLDPVLSAEPPARAETVADCLERVDIRVPADTAAGARCICTVASPGFEAHLDDLLGSLAANGECHDARRVVFAVDADEACRRVAAKHGALLVECTRRAHVNATVKSVMYSAARVLQAERFICLDADMLVLGSLEPVFAALDACPEGSVLACREGRDFDYRDVEEAVATMYAGREGDVSRVVGGAGTEGAYPLVVNDGLFAGRRAALLVVDGLIRGWTGAQGWVDERHDVWWRNQAVFNLALAHLGCGVELDTAYNVQLHCHDARMHWEDGRVAASWNGRPARVLHFSGAGRQKYPEWRGLYAKVDAPLPRVGGGDGYAAFLSALRGWVGRHGTRALAWSFYGTADGQDGRVADADVFPLLGLLHYLLRANGCARVIETGTAAGVSAACIASAVAHRPGAAVVTLDLGGTPGPARLWESLPAAMRSCVEARQGDSLALMDAALARGERYDAALLDSLHEESFVYAEFQRAARLVCPGGLILLHDPTWAGGTVDRALRRIEADGYGVARLWTAECGHAEDDGLGLAVVENRRRASAAA